jgi:hypothetical protein
MILHSKPTTRRLIHIREHPLVLGQVTGTWTHLTHHGPNSGEATTFPHIVFSVVLCQGYTSKWHFFPGLPKWNLETVATLTWPSVGVKPNTWKSWGFGVLRDFRMFRAR